MIKLRDLLRATVLASSLFVLAGWQAGASGAVTDSAATAIDAGEQSQRCCWVYHVGGWYCIPC
jgi:hypothetical protein